MSDGTGVFRCCIKTDSEGAKVDGSLCQGLALETGNACLPTVVRRGHHCQILGGS